MKKVARVLVAVVMLLGVSVILASAGGVQLFADTWYRGRFGWFSVAFPQPRNISEVNNDSLSSFKNETNWSVAFWRERDGNGRCFTGEPQSKAPTFAWWDDNAVSSFQIGRAC